MSDPIDRQACRVACDLIEEAGFDPAVVAFFRKACAPTVAEVLPLAIAFRKQWPRSLYDFWNHQFVEDDYLRSQFGAYMDQSFLSLLLLMSPGQRRKVARRTIRAIREEEHQAEVARGWAMTPPANPYSWSVPSEVVPTTFRTQWSSDGIHWNEGQPPNRDPREVVHIRQFGRNIDPDRFETPVGGHIFPMTISNPTGVPLPPGTPMVRNPDGTFSPADPTT